MTKMREMIISSQDFFCFYFYFSLLHFSPPKLWKSIKKIYFPPTILEKLHGSLFVKMRQDTLSYTLGGPNFILYQPTLEERVGRVLAFS